jgi:hypothetical protein
MGRIAIPIGVSIDRVKKVFGSKDEALINKVLASDTYLKFDEDHSFKRELYDIIFNYVPVENRIVQPSKLFGLIKGDDGRGLKGDWNDYGYALLVICSHLGEKFSETNTEYIYGDSWWKINTVLRENGSSLDLSRMHETKQIFDTPFEADDIYINSYSKEEVRQFLDVFTAQDEKTKEHHSELYSSLKKGLLHCAENNLDVVVFSFETL